MRKLFIIFLWLSYLPLITRGQNMEDPDLQELLQPIQAKSIGYWFDNDASNLQKTDDLSGSYLPDVSSLSDGMHTIHYLLQATDGTVSSIKTDVFVKTEEVLSDDIFGASISAKSVAYWFDEDVSSLQTSNDLSGAYVINVSPLGDGLHTLHYVLLGNDGTAYSIKTETFIKMEGILPDDIIGTSVAAKSFAYWFDEDISSLQTTDDLSGIYVLDVSSLSDGLHTLHYHVVGADGNIYGTTTTMFLKDEEQFAVHEPNRITKYMYWLNHDNSTVRTVTLDQPTNPYTLISLLPLQRMPIRSSNFHFQIDDGVPTIYAKNDFNIRFYDSQGEFVDNFMENERTFIDYGVSQKIEPVGELQATQTFNRIGENKIRWYTLEAVRGDSLSFKTDKACSIQLFSPSGENVYISFGAGSVNWDGCHAREDGTYYLALHDVTAKTGTEITLDYQHIDKYAILRQDVSVVGNGGCSTITFEGNGFRDLYAVDLFNELGNSIHHAYIAHESDATTSVTFDFSDATLGNYNAIFYFAEDDLVVENLLSVEKARAIELASDVSYSSSYLSIARKSTYVIKVTNKGNMTAYYVPIYITLSGSIDKISVTGQSLKSVYESISDSNDWSENDKKMLKELSDEIGDTHYFPKIKDSDESEGEISNSRKGIIFIEVPPYTTKNIPLHVSTGNQIDVKVSLPDVWESAVSEGKNVPLSNSVKDWFCCNHDKIECITAVLSESASLAGFFPPVAVAAGVTGCVTGALNNLSDFGARMYCSGYKPQLNQNMRLKDLQSKASLLSTALSCVSASIKKAKDIAEILNATSAVTGLPSFMEATGLGGCKRAWSDDSECPPTKALGGTSTPVGSWDPNDIYGYTAETGSHAVKDGLTDVYYRIEFENDPEHATASAHEIVVSDQLNAAKFDLSTFKPTRIEIGQKSAELTGDKNFVTTIDMRPEIYAIAQVKGTFDESTGLAKWYITTLDPMTMEPTEDPMNGVLPINEDGSGIGQILFDISLKDGLAHGTEIPNQATIIFDANEPITTPTWTNIVDAVHPASKVDYTSMEKPDTVTLHFTSEDDGSGVWRYTVYVQDGKNAPWREVGVTDSCAFDFEYAEGIDYGFCVLATDSAGNVEHKELVREAKLHSFVAGDANSDGIVDTKDAVLVISYYLGRSDTYLNMSAADIVEDDVIDTKDAVAIINKYLTTSTSPKAKTKKNRKRIRVL